ncbi:MAG: hypothetical protein JWP12_2466 [Bacteroidetes bacterium]|nr:hypothetical protein [Bacteroidota bacterium]
MYNLAKLLTEEPAKLERLGILFLKLLVTLFIGSAFLGFNISISDFVENPVPKDYTISKFIFFLIMLVIIWFVVWTLIAELIIGELMIWLLSKIGNKKTIFTDVLHFLDVVKKNNETLSPNKYVIVFNQMLHSYTDEDEKVITESKSRVRQYFLVVTVVYVALLLAKDVSLPCGLKWFGGIMIVNLLIVNVIFNQIHNYFSDNLDEMKKQFSRMAFSQMIINAIEQNPFIKNHYEKSDNWQRIHLNKKTELDWLPESFKFFPVYYWNDTLTKIMLDKGLQKREGKEIKPEKIGNHYDVVVCNVKPDDENVKSILSQRGFAYLHCENEEQIYKNLEVLLFKVTNGMYRIN